MIISLILILSEVSDFIIDWAPIFGALAAIVAIYKFFIKRPALVLQAEVDSSSPNQPFEIVSATPTLFLSNEGRDFAEDAHLEIELLDWDFHQEDDSQDISAFLDVSVDKTGYLGSPRTLYQISSNKPIQPRDKYKMFFGGTEFERGRCYEIEYTVSCRSHSPRTGSIVFQVGYNDVDVIHNYPTRRRRFMIAVRELFYCDLEETAMLKLIQYNIEWVDEKEFRVSAMLRNNGFERARIAMFDFDIFIGDAKPENYHGTITHQVLALDSGECWRLVFEGKLTEPVTKDDISIIKNTSEQSNHLSYGWDRVHLVDYTGDLPSDSNSTIRIDGRVENMNAGTERTAHVVAKVFDKNGFVLGTEDSRIKLEPGEVKDFRLRPRVGNEHLDDVDDYDVVLMG